MRNFDVDEPEAVWVEAIRSDPRRAGDLLARALEVTSEAVAFATQGWVLALANDLPIAMGGTQRNRRFRYRQVLLEIGPPRQPRKGPSDGRRAKKAVSGTKARRLARGGGTAVLVALATPIILVDEESAAPARVATLPVAGKVPILGTIDNELAA